MDNFDETKDQDGGRRRGAEEHECGGRRREARFRFDPFCLEGVWHTKVRELCGEEDTPKTKSRLLVGVVLVDVSVVVVVYVSVSVVVVVDVSVSVSVVVIDYKLIADPYLPFVMHACK